MHYDGAEDSEEELRNVLTRQRNVLCLLTVLYAKKIDEHHWFRMSISVGGERLRQWGGRDVHLT